MGRQHVRPRRGGGERKKIFDRVGVTQRLAFLMVRSSTASISPESGTLVIFISYRRTRPPSLFYCFPLWRVPHVPPVVRGDLVGEWPSDLNEC